MEPQATAAAAFFGMVKAGYSAGIQLPSAFHVLTETATAPCPALCRASTPFLKLTSQDADGRDEARP
jgi:hypothetical protein